MRIAIALVVLVLLMVIFGFGSAWLLLAAAIPCALCYAIGYVEGAAFMLRDRSPVKSAGPPALPPGPHAQIESMIERRGRDLSQLRIYHEEDDNGRSGTAQEVAG